MDQGGITRAKLDSDHHQTLRGLENVIAMLLAGRAAEELVLPDEATAGAGNGENSDFARATAIAADIETKLGFGVFGPVQLSERSSEIMLQDPRVFEAVRARMVKCLAIAQETVAINEAPILAIAGSLNKTGYLGKQAINALLQQYPLLRPLRHCIPVMEDQDA
jgi:cell division protease FtsH